MVSLGLFLGFLGLTTVGPFLPLFMLELGAADARQATFLGGIAVGATPLAAAVLSPLWGRQADRSGVRRVAVLLILAFSVVHFLMGLTGEIWQVITLRVVNGCFGGLPAVGMALAMQYFPPHESGRGVALAQVARLLGWFGGPLVGGVVTELFGVRGVFFATSLLTGLAFVILARLLTPPPASPTVSSGVAAAAATVSLSALRSFWFVALLLALLAVNAVERSFDPLVPLVVSQRAPGDAPLGLLVGAISGVGTLGTAVASELTGRQGGRRALPLLFASLGVMAAASLLLAGSTHLWQFVALRVLVGLGAGSALTVVFSLGSMAAGPGRVATSLAILGSGALWGSALGSMLGGALGSLELRLPFLMDAAAVVLALLLVVAVVRSRALPTRPR